MKLNRNLLVAAAAVVIVGGSVAVVGCNRADDDAQDERGAVTEQANESGSSEQPGVEKDYYRGGGWGGRGYYGGRGWGWGRGYAGRGWNRGWGYRGGRYGYWAPNAAGYCTDGVQTWYCY